MQCNAEKRRKENDKVHRPPFYYHHHHFSNEMKEITSTHTERHARTNLRTWSQDIINLSCGAVEKFDSFIKIKRKRNSDAQRKGWRHAVDEFTASAHGTLFPC